MELEKITPVEQRKLNRNNIYQFIRNAKNTSKKDIADSLQLSLPTVTQNLKELEAEGLVIREGLYDSSCGRKAQIIACNPTAFFAIGVEVLKEEIQQEEVYQQEQEQRHICQIVHFQKKKGI